MRREQQIPLFLWVATALVAHALGGGGATKVAQQIEETMDIGSFASAVRAKAKFVGPIEVTFEEPPPPEEEDASPDENSKAPEADSNEADPTEEDPDKDEADDEVEDDALVEKEKPPEEEKREAEKEKTPEEKAAEKPPEEEKPPELLLAQKPKPKPVPNRRVAVEQHVDDKNQEDNPNAQFAGEHANRVAEETQARITSTDQNAQDTSAGNTFKGEEPDPGNSEESEVAQSDENDSPDNQGPGSTPQQAMARASHASPAANAARQELPSQAPKTEQSAQAAREAKSASEARDGMFETHLSGGGAFALSKAQEARAAQEAQKARRAREILRAFQPKKAQPLFGYGSAMTTENGVRLSLSQEMAEEVIGHDQLDHLKEQVGKRRLSQHRGSWQNIGLDRWRGAIENYVASVKPGNQTALNTARVPFAAYLNQIHQRLHEVFAHGFLGHLEQLPDKHPLNNRNMSTHIEIALSREDGRIVKMGVTKSSGVTAFDVGALESVSKAAPYGPPPGSIVSSDGNVYLHWEFHRNRDYACSTYFARPFIIDTGPTPAPPRVEPPPKPDERENRNPDERSGALQPRTTPSRSARSSERSKQSAQPEPG